MGEYSSDEKIKHGTVKIANEVVTIIAGLAATEIEGVAGMSGGLTGDITEMLGMKNLSKGVKIEINNKDALIDIFLLVEYGFKISEIASNVQSNVKNAVESMTGLNVLEVNVNVQGVNTPKDEPKIDNELIKK